MTRTMIMYLTPHTTPAAPGQENNMQAYAMYDKELDEWYVSIYDADNPDNSRQFFGYTTEEQAAADIPLLIAKMRHVWTMR